MRKINMEWRQLSHSHTVALKKDFPPSIAEFDKILDSISHEDDIGHLFAIDIKFHDINEKTLLFNELYPPIFEKNKKIDPYEQSMLQLMSIAVRNEEKDKLTVSHIVLKLTQHLRKKSSCFFMLKIYIF